MSDPTNNGAAGALAAPTPGTPWTFTFATIRRRWPKAVLRVTMLAESGPEAFVALAVQLTATGTGATDVASAFGPTDVDALRALVGVVQGRAPSAPAPERPSP